MAKSRFDSSNALTGHRANKSEEDTMSTELDRALAELDRADEELTYARNHGDAQQVADARRDYVNAVEAVAQCSEVTR